MKLFVFIIKRDDYVKSFTEKLASIGVSAASVIDSKGVAKLINQESVDPPPIFGSLRHFVNPIHEDGKTVLVAADDSKAEAIRRAFLELKDSLPDIGVLLAVDLCFTEGL